MSKETKFGYGFLLAGVGVPYLIEKLLGAVAALVIAALCVVAGVGLLVAGHLHRDKTIGFELPQSRTTPILTVAAFHFLPLNQDHHSCWSIGLWRDLDIVRTQNFYHSPGWNVSGISHLSGAPFDIFDSSEGKSFDLVMGNLRIKIPNCVWIVQKIVPHLWWCNLKHLLYRSIHPEMLLNGGHKSVLKFLLNVRLGRALGRVINFKSLSKPKVTFWHNYYPQISDADYVMGSGVVLSMDGYGRGRFFLRRCLGCGSH